MAQIEKKFWRQEQENEATEIDKVIHDYVFQNSHGDYEILLQEEKRFSVHMALSELRRGLFNWYSFKENARVLEIGGGYGALTGLFCEKAQEVVVTERSLYRAQIIEKRYGHVDNLSIYAGDIMDMSFEKGFDYIILTGILERVGKGTFTERIYADYLSALKRFLNPAGVILAAVDNRYGLRYFAGMKDIHTNKVFDGIRRYPEGNKGAHSFDKQEINKVCNLSDFKAHKVYYPLPDYRMPQLIYTDQHLPENNLKERLIPYYTDHSSVIFNENIVYDDLVKNEVFPFFANSFLIELSDEVEALDKAVYAAVSTDRGKERSFATVIYDNDVVIKKPLYQEGVENARKLYTMQEEIRSHGLTVVSQKFESGDIVMPCIQAPMLSNYIKDIIAERPDEVKEIVEKLWQNILISSEEVSASDNKLLTEETKNLSWGPILKKVYMELIPLNCFYQNGEFIYFDQEFVKTDYPAKYALFRAIHYIYGFTMRAGKYIPIEYFKEKYEMTELWDIFLQEEKRFLDEVRKHEAHKMFYQWAHCDSKRMQQNVDRLNHDSFPAAVYQPAQTLKSVERKVAEGTESGKPYKIGYVPGVYDLFHVGHLNLIRRSKERCDYLIVGVLTDELVEHFKHKRPYIPYEERAAVVAAIREVDEVVPVDFSNTRKIDAWHMYHFDCHFSGNDHGADWASDMKMLQEVGSNMEFFPYTQGTSSTQIKQRMKEA